MNKEDTTFDFEKALKAIQGGQPLLGKEGIPTLNDEIEQKIIALYGFGMSYRDISSHLQEM